MTDSVAPGQRPYNSATRPPLFTTLAYLLMNLPVGIAGFVILVTLISTGLGTAIIWVGVPLLALVVLGSRGAAQLERWRVRLLLNTPISGPYRPLPTSGWKEQWKTRLRDGATWRDMAYFVLLFPLGIIEFSLMVGLWAASLGLMALPVSFHYLPEEAYFFPSDDLSWITIDSTLDTLPWAALGVLLTALAVFVTRETGLLHARFAQAMLGGTPPIEPTRTTDHDNPHSETLPAAEADTAIRQ